MVTLLPVSVTLSSYNGTPSPPRSGELKVKNWKPSLGIHWPRDANVKVTMWKLFMADSCN